MKLAAFIITFLFFQFSTIAQNVVVEVNAAKTLFDVSPYIYGKNNNFSDQSSSAASASEIIRYKDSGLRFVRENSGNNATKYNWRKKLSSHPDWYNNVYEHNWDQEAAFIQNEFPNMQIMYGFQLLGKVAANSQHNFSDWNYNNSQWWEGVAQNLAGEGVVNPNGGTDALSEGDINLYLEDWPADSTTEILKHWFGSNGLNYTKEKFQYWSMDNEPEIWAGTHDDVMHSQISADGFMELYFDVALKAREKYPNIKLCGPVVANEWQWYKYSDQTLKIDGQYYCWLEYFIKKAADKEKETGIRVLDVLDIHWYPGESDNAKILQQHRVFFDEDYNYPGANGVKTISGGWNANLKNEYIFKRINNWLNKYYGENHGIGIGMTEFGGKSNDANINATLYASILGTFANHGVELFSPWTWKKGMWEVLHLFSRYSKTTSVESISDNEEYVSGYSTINSSGDSLTVMLVNRSLNLSQNVIVNLSNYEISNSTFNTFQLESLTSDETFISHSNNALNSSEINVAENSFRIDLPALSTTAVLLTGTKTGIENLKQKKLFRIYPNPTKNEINIELNKGENGTTSIAVFNYSGKLIESHKCDNINNMLKINAENYSEGIYFIEAINGNQSYNQKVIITK